MALKVSRDAKCYHDGQNENKIEKRWLPPVCETIVSLGKIRKSIAKQSKEMFSLKNISIK